MLLSCLEKGGRCNKRNPYCNVPGYCGGGLPRFYNCRILVLAKVLLVHIADFVDAHALQRGDIAIKLG